MSKITLRDRLNAIKREREAAEMKAFTEASPEEQFYIIHRDYQCLAREVRKTRRWMFLVLLFSFIALSQIAQFFVR